MLRPFLLYCIHNPRLNYFDKHNPFWRFDSRIFTVSYKMCTIKSFRFNRSNQRILLFYPDFFLLNSVPTPSFPLFLQNPQKTLLISFKYIDRLVNKIASINNLSQNAIHYYGVCDWFLKMILIMKLLL